MELKSELNEHVIHARKPCKVLLKNEHTQESMLLELLDNQLCSIEDSTLKSGKRSACSIDKKIEPPKNGKYVVMGLGHKVLLFKSRTSWRNPSLSFEFTSVELLNNFDELSTDSEK